jgi:hypothetical protein
MNMQEYLLVCLSEECAEIQKAAMKAIRFGIDKGNPFKENFVSNRQDIEHEISDLLTVVEILNSENIIHMKLDRAYAKRKKRKIHKYIDVSISCGTLEGKE